jgi:hypothetical protein
MRGSRDGSRERCWIARDSVRLDTARHRSTPRDACGCDRRHADDVAMQRWSCACVASRMIASPASSVLS